MASLEWVKADSTRYGVLIGMQLNHCVKCIIIVLKPEKMLNKRMVFEYIEVFYNRIRRHAKK